MFLFILSLLEMDLPILSYKNLKEFVCNIGTMGVLKDTFKHSFSLKEFVRKILLFLKGICHKLLHFFYLKRMCLVF